MPMLLMELERRMSDASLFAEERPKVIETESENDVVIALADCGAWVRVSSQLHPYFTEIKKPADIAK